MLEIYGVGMEDFMSSLGESRVDEGLARLLDEPLLKTLNLSRDDLASLGAEPKAATTITALFNLFKNARVQLENLQADVADRTQVGASGGATDVSFDYSPFDEVTDFLEEHGNYFPRLEARAESFRRDAGIEALTRSAELARALLDHLGVRVDLVDTATRSSVIRRYDRRRGRLSLSANLAEHRRVFQLAHTIGLRLLDEEGLDQVILRNHRPQHSETTRLLKIHLANYLAGAILLPYDAFYREVMRTRYDVEMLASTFATSYETVAHRICNLGDPERPGLPFHFLRVDVAGNISKRYSATGLKFPKGVGSCPKWAVHTAFLTPHAIRRQYSEFPDGSRFFCFARVQSEPLNGSLSRGTVYSIGLGTNAENAKSIAYADDMPFVDPERMAVPVGTTCRFCERPDCNQRAAPSYKFAFRVDEYTKKDNFFSPLVNDDQASEER